MATVLLDRFGIGFQKTFNRGGYQSLNFVRVAFEKRTELDLFREKDPRF